MVLFFKGGVTGNLVNTTAEILGLLLCANELMALMSCKKFRQKEATTRKLLIVYKCTLNKKMMQYFWVKIFKFIMA